MLLILLLLPAFLWRDGTSAPTVFSGIVPKSKTKGIDFCGVAEYYYIVRSDLGLYMRSTNFHEGVKHNIFSLHQSVRGGDHYLAHKDDLFYIIKGNSYRRVTNLNTDSSAVVYTLHPNCQRGDHYFSSGNYFYIIFKNKGIVRRVTNMHEDIGAYTFPIHSDLKGCPYYWGTDSYAYCLSPDYKWGVQYKRTTNFEKNSDPITYSFHVSVTDFLPGGLGFTFGKSFSIWNRVSTIINDASIAVSREYSITRKTGYEKQKMKSMENHWDISASASVGAGGLTSLLVQAQFSLETSYGGVTLDTTTETWTESTEITEKINFTLPPKKKIYVWQFKLGLGKEDIFYSRGALAFTDTATPPDINPFDPSKN